ncbi:hypothetical protein FOZ60_003136 [Perkinsus olseni]|uniref:Kelch-like n=2 Tax=Perkinsus olseni TaxID=32597 RepID=A0A7J6NW87_PEROL|nr:hypothetical protein FOZ60_003136 [Perkinsus olseni]
MTGPLPLKILCLLLVQSIFPVHSAELPCPTSLAVNVTVGGVPAYISATNELLHGQSQGRQCSSVKEGWTGLVMLRCANGILSAVVNCTGQPCGVYRTTSVTLGPITGTITPPFELVSSSPWDDTSATPQLVYGERLCGSVNENYRGIIKLRCVEGVLLTDIDACEPQWTQTSTAFPATPRSQSQAVTLGDGAILLLGGFDTTSRTNDNWLWRPSHNDSQYYDELTREVGPPDSYDPHGGSWKKLVLPSGGVPWQPRLGHSAVRVYTESIEDDRVMLLAGSAGEMMNDVWMWTRKPLRRQLPIASHLSRLVGVSPRGCSLDDGLIECVTDLGPVGRRLAIDEDWRRCTAFETEIMYEALANHHYETMIHL